MQILCLLLEIAVCYVRIIFLCFIEFHNENSKQVRNTYKNLIQIFICIVTKPKYCIIFMVK